jgi:transposase-like protein
MSEGRRKIVKINDISIEFNCNEIYRMEFNIEKIHEIFRREKFKKLKFLASLRLIKNEMTCPECSDIMHLIVDNKSLDGYIWKCENFHKKFR